MQNRLAMKNLPPGHRLASVLAIAVLATIGAMMAALPAVASGANTLSLGVEPTIPKKGKPFQLIATGTSEMPDPTSGLHNDVEFGFAPGTGPCASTAELEFAKPNSFSFGQRGVVDGAFDLRETYSGGSADGGLTFPPYALNNGVVAGHYRACGYLFKFNSPSSPPFAAARHAFTVGGTCDSATNKLGTAKQNLRKAKRQLRKAKRQAKRASTSTQKRKAQRKVRSAKKQVKKGKKMLRAAKADHAALCLSPP